MLITKRIGFAAFAGAALLFFVLPVGCSGAKETLIVAALTAEPAAPGLDAATVTIGSTQKGFGLTSGLSSSAVNVGVYVPSGVSGPITVSVTATGSGVCYRGSKATTIVTAGVQVNVDVVLTPDPTCAGGPDGGAGAGGATGGSGGSAAGSSGMGGGAAGSAGAGGTAGGSAGAGGTAGAAGAGGSAGAGGTAGAAGTGGTGGVGGAGGVPQVLAWGAGENVAKDPLVSSQWPHVAIDPTHGNVLVAYVSDQFPAVKRYDAAKKLWGTATVLDNRGQVQEVSVAMDDLGHALVVWVQYDGAPPTADLKGIWFSHSEDGGVSWAAPARIHMGPAWGDLSLGMASDGSARVAWDETDGIARSLWSASYSPATKTFTGASMVKLGNNVYERLSRMAIAPGGHGLLTWIQGDGAGKDSVWGSSFTTPSGALTSPVLVDSYVDNDNANQSVAISLDGTHGFVAWEQQTASTEDIWTSDWTAAGGFAAEQKAFAGSGIAGPAVAMDASYTVTMAWSQQANSGKWQVTASRRPNGQAWGTPAALESANQAGSYTNEIAYASAAVDGAGNVQVLWTRKMHAPRTDHTFGVFVRRYSSAVWAPEVQLGVKEGLRAFNYPLAVGADGRAAATFFYGDPDGVGDPEAFNVFVSLFK